ncbi:MAG: hypothetical protein LQ351_004480 [Letrouitia transgressa]|nr:MAG: hypothetical protein LQ351_004480 [Letrouitia transgressa]
MVTSTRPPNQRQQSKVPGGFETDEDISPIKPEFDYENAYPFEQDTTSSQHASKLERTSAGGDSLPPTSSDDGTSHIAGEGNTVDEKEIRRKLMDMDSSFLPEISPTSQRSQLGKDDTYVFGSLNTASEDVKHPANVESQDPNVRKDEITESPATPPEMYKTPAPGREELPEYGVFDSEEEQGHFNTSALETISSSPTAAAAARTVSRAVSMASIGGYETADDSHISGVPLVLQDNSRKDDNEVTPRRRSASLISSSAASPTPTRPTTSIKNDDGINENVGEHMPDSPQTKGRPKFLRSRMASQRSSYSSYTTTSTEEGSNLTLGADYALQSGGSVPSGGSISSRPGLMARGSSLGSMASGITNMSDGDDRLRSTGGPLESLDTLDEEDSHIENASSRGREQTKHAPETPRALSRSIATPTDTVIAQHVKDVQVPLTMAEEFQDHFRPGSPSKHTAAPTPSLNRHGKSMTLKEQSNTIDKYMKLNWDLQLKITFLNQALNQRSDEGVKAMISENVELNTARVNLAKEIRELKRTIRTLERDLEKRTDELGKSAKALREAENRAGPGPEVMQDLENEILYLRERITIHEVEVEKMKHESLRQDGEKRRMADILKSMSRKGGNDIGAREELDYYKDELEAETARREEADEENKQLREEIWRLQSESQGTSYMQSLNPHDITENRQASSTISKPSLDDFRPTSNTIASAASSTLVEQLRHENAKLQRDMRAQESMLTSRNREKEHLYQEIEELKLAARRGEGARSVAGESIFERSASRAYRRNSRASEMPPSIQLNDVERERYETANGELRDEINARKLEIQDMNRQLEVCLDELAQYDVFKADHENLRNNFTQEMTAITEDLQVLQAERDEALQVQEQLDAELEEQRARFEDLQAEAGERINGLDDELDQKAQELQNTENELSNHVEQADALRAEVRSLSERIIRIEDEMQAKQKRIDDLEIEVEAVTNETEEIHKDRAELRDQHERLTVQYESSQSQIAFLREEQDGDKIKIGDLENSLNSLQNTLNSERDRAKELDNRIAEERQQREAIGSKEKQEVQKMMNDLNREASGAKDESRLLKTTLQSTEIELTTWKERLLELESNLREALGDSKGTRSTFLTSITKLQKELSTTSADLETTRNTLSEKERLLRSRDSLLESHGLESKKLSDLLERERQGRRADKAQHEQWQRTHQHTTRTVSQKDIRIAELESSKQSDRKRLQVLESQLKEQLLERNTLLLSLWTRISAVCGPDWQHQNNLINGHVPTLEVVSSMLPAFSKTLLLGVKHIENIMTTFKARVKTIERDLQKQYQNLESSLDDRIKKLDKLEQSVQSSRVQGTFSAAPEIAKLRGENRLLKSEIAVLQKHESRIRASQRAIPSSRDTVAPLESHNSNNTGSAPPPTLARHHSTSAVEHGNHGDVPPPYGNQRSPQRISSLIPFTPLSRSDTAESREPSQQRWTHRLRELERRLKAEREARLTDRTGARKRLEEGLRENEGLKAELERERERNRRGK